MWLKEIIRHSLWSESVFFFFKAGFFKRWTHSRSLPTSEFTTHQLQLEPPAPRRLFQEAQARHLASGAAFVLSRLAMTQRVPSAVSPGRRSGTAKLLRPPLQKRARNFRRRRGGDVVGGASVAHRPASVSPFWGSKRERLLNGFSHHAEAAIFLFVRL